MTDGEDDGGFPQADEVSRRIAPPDGWRVRPVAVSEVRSGCSRRTRAEALVKAFNSWAFKREQPDNLEGLKRLAMAAVDANAPLAFVLYWGRGPRKDIGAAERQCLDFLLGLVRRIENLHAPGAEVTIIFTDTHAELNGYPPLDTRRYFEQVKREASDRAFDTCFLSDLVLRAGGRIDPARAMEAAHPDLLAALIVSAAKWYRGLRSTEDGAREYYRANMIEKQAVEAAFPDAVFITFNGGEHRPLFPDRMPVFYMYSLRRGVSIKPWFMAAEPDGPVAPDACERVQ